MFEAKAIKQLRKPMENQRKVNGKPAEKHQKTNGPPMKTNGKATENQRKTKGKQTENKRKTKEKKTENQLKTNGKQKEKHADPDRSLVPNLRPEQTRARALLEDADALAAQGRFAEAVHLLLFRSIDEIQSKRSGVIGRSLTSREIGALGVLPEPVRDTLLPIIRIVERSFFGGQDVNETGWQEARASYEHFAFGAAWT